MEARLLDYLLNALEEEDRRGVEAMLAADEEARRLLELLRLALLPLGSSQRHDEPPEGLAVRTCKLVRDNRRSDSES